MEWHKRLTMYQHPLNKPSILSGESERDFLLRLTRLNGQTKIGARMLSHEASWVNEGKPYYKVWPCISDGLSRVKLNIPCETAYSLMLKMPLGISIRFAVGSEPECGRLRLRECFVSVAKIEVHGRIYFGVEVHSNTGETLPNGFPVCNTISFRFVDGSIVDAIENLSRESSVDSTLTDDERLSCELAVRFYFGIAMLHDNPDFVEAVVLRKDAAKYAETRDPKYVEKAKRRGEYGWNVGANIEVLPHFRRPHFAIRWTGKGSEVPKLVPVKGCVVKRSKFTDVPTGYQVDEEAADPIPS